MKYNVFIKLVPAEIRWKGGQTTQIEENNNAQLRVIKGLRLILPFWPHVVMKTLNKKSKKSHKIKTKYKKTTTST